MMLLHTHNTLFCLMQSLEELIDKAVPRDIRVRKQLQFDAALGGLFPVVQKSLYFYVVSTLRSN